ncbi:MAG: inner membrane protein YiaA [Cytophagales bacterium]|nr:inner membrane protein YiaA [Cytophagales bacterium]
MKPQIQKPTGAFIAAAWAALLIGMTTFFVGLWNSDLQLNEKGFYFTVLMYGLFSAVSLQKSVRDKLDGIPVTGIYFGLCWVSVGLAILLLTVGLWNAKLADSEKGFYAMSFLLGLFGAISVQKNVRDLSTFATDTPVMPAEVEASTSQAN